ncbi:MAG: sugar phosphate isomerase/epimerase [Verrucomicrobiota bacterium]
MQTTAVATAATASETFTATAQNKKVNWPIGCFNRPWVKNWNYAETLASIKAAGYKLTGLLTKTKDDVFIAAEATPEYLAALKKKIAASGLTANMAAIRTKNDLSLPEQIKDVRKQIDHGKFLDLEYLLTFGVDKPAHYENYYKLMADGAAYAKERGIKLVLKPHGGGSGASEEIIRCLDKVKHPNFKIWYDAGNIIHYTGKDPIEQLKPIAQHVTGFCAKDCATQKGDVMIQFGKGKVDFRGVFSELKKAGFNGPVMVECCELSDDLNVITANAKANREFLENLFASL